MVTETVEETIVRLFARLAVHDDRSNVCFALRGFSGADRLQEQAVYGYDMACHGLDPGTGAPWEAERRAALASMVARIVEDGLLNDARAAKITFPAAGAPSDDRRLLVQYTVASGEGSNTELSSDGHQDLRNLLAELSGLHPGSGRTPPAGVLHHCYSGREYAIPVSLSPMEVILDLAKATSSPRPPGKAPHGFVARGAQRIARVVTAQALLDGATEIRVALGKQGSAIEAALRVGNEWHVPLALRAETFVHGRDPKEPGIPLEHPLWLPLREAFAELAGVVLRPAAARQTARFEFAADRVSHALRATFTPKLVRVEVG